MTGNLTGSVTGNASTATAFAANGANCSVNQYAQGVDAAGNAEGCSLVNAAALTGTLAAAQFPAHTGDVTTIAGSLVTTIANAAVTNAKLANSSLTVTAGTGLSGGGGVSLGGSATLNVAANTTNQKVEVMKAGTSVGTRKTVNLIEGTSVTMTVADDAVNDRVNVTVNSSASGGSSFPTADGTAAAPAWNFTNEANSGVFRNAANDVAVSIGGTKTVDFKANQASFTGGTVTASTPALDVTQTWNSSGITFTGLRANFTDTASAAASLLADLQVGGISKFKVDKSGNESITGVQLTADGAASAPALSFTAETNSGIYRNAASDMAVSINGTKTVDFKANQIVIAGGTATITSPVLDITQTWNSGATVFTGLRANFTNTASNAASMLIDLQVGGSSMMSVGRAGALTIASNMNASAGFFTGGVYPGGSARSFILSNTDGNLTLANNANNNFTMLQFGGTTASFPGFKRNTTSLEAKLADDTGYTGFKAATITAAKSFVGVINTVTFSATPAFDASLANTQKITLTANVTSSTLSNAVAGQVLYFLICQDATGTRTFAWPANVLGATTIGSTASKCNAQSFVFDGTNAYALAAGVTNQ